MAIKHRSGRFTQAGNFVAGRANVFYRVINSAEFDPTAPETNEIVVKYGPGGPNQNAVRVLPSFSVDVFVDRQLTINGLGDIQGLYEVVPGLAVRNGRFKTRGNMATGDGVLIVAGTHHNYRGVYRIFNSGESAYDVIATRGKQSSVIGQVNPGQSLDFVTRPELDVMVRSRTGNDHIEGMYELLKEVE